MQERISIGNVEVLAVVDMYPPGRATSFFFPDVPEEAWDPYRDEQLSPTGEIVLPHGGGGPIREPAGYGESASHRCIDHARFSPGCDQPHRIDDGGAPFRCDRRPGMRVRAIDTGGAFTGMVVLGQETVEVQQSSAGHTQRVRVV